MAEVEEELKEVAVVMRREDGWVRARVNVGRTSRRRSDVLGAGAEDGNSQGFDDATSVADKAVSEL